MDNYSGKIDLKLLDNSIKIIYEIQNFVNNTNIAASFEELEKYFRKINFEHSYCINYKESIETIYADLNDIRRDINRISEITTVVKNSYKELDEDKSTKDAVKSILRKATTSINDGSEENITRIEQPTPEQSLQKKPYSTIPIGLAIGATGIAGSVGAVVVNEKYGPEIAELEVEEYHDLNDDNPDFDVNETPEKEEEEISLYHASRTSREADKYYGNDNEIDLEDYDDSDTQDFDNDDFDDYS